MEFKEKFKKEYLKLNTKQKEAVDSIEGPVMVIAGPGTGKTTILSLRIANILDKTDTNPENILALTYTNAGVYSMRKKLIENIGDDAYRVNIFTFHAFCDSLIKSYPQYFENFENGKAIDDLEKIKIIEEIIKTNNFSKLVGKKDENSKISLIIHAIDDIKKEGLNPLEFKNRIPVWRDDLLSDESIYYKKNSSTYKKGDIKPSEQKKIEERIEKTYQIAEIFGLYQERLIEKGYYDFNDMILIVLDQLENNKEFKLDIQEKLQYILVDEHQDTNDGQNKIIELLTDAEHLDGRPNIFTVGDEKQSIFRFAGASEKTFKHLHSIYKDIKVISLDQNYRSSQNILDGALSLIQFNSEGVESVRLQSNKKENNKIIYKEFSSYKMELLNLAESIEKDIKNGVNPSEIAVIYRANKNSDDIKNIFALKKIPFSVFSKDDILSDYQINNLIYILKSVENHKDDASLAKVFFADFLNFDSHDILQVLNIFNLEKRKRNIDLFEFIQSKDDLEKNNIKNPDQFINLTSKLKDLKIISENDNFLNFFKIFLEEIGYINYLIKSSNSLDIILKLDKIFDEIKRQQEKISKFTLLDFINFIDSYKKYNLEIESNDPEILDGVKLMTAHKSKGLEFENVYIINCTRNSWENKKSGHKFSLPIDNYVGSEEDERRLFYVSMTRAKNNLCIFSSLTDWQGKEQEKSQFIGEIDQKNIDFVDVKEYEKSKIGDLILFIRNGQNHKSFWDKNYLKNLFLERGLNVTAINNYLKCPIEFLFKNLVRLPEEYNTSLLFGNIIHHSLRIFFDESKKNKNILLKQDLLNFFDKELNKIYMNDNDFKKSQKRGHELLSEYYDNYNKDFILNVDTEVKIKKKFKLNNGQDIELRGDIDKIEYLENSDSGLINLVDYKTGSSYSQKEKEQKEALDRQIIFYSILLDGYKNDRYKINQSRLEFVEKNEKKDEYEIKIIDVNNEQINNLKQTINDISDKIISGRFLEEGCNKKDCKYCNLLIKD